MSIGETIKGLYSHLNYYTLANLAGHNNLGRAFTSTYEAIRDEIILQEREEGFVNRINISNRYRAKMKNQSQ